MVRIQCFRNIEPVSLPQLTPFRVYRRIEVEAVPSKTYRQPDRQVQPTMDNRRAVEWETDKMECGVPPTDRRAQILHKYRCGEVKLALLLSRYEVEHTLPQSHCSLAAADPFCAVPHLSVFALLVTMLYKVSVASY